MSIRVRDVSAGYGSGLVLNNVSLEVPDVGLVGIIGRNGAGKTTLLRTIMGLLPLARGEVEIFGRSIRGRRPDELARSGVGYMPQEGGVFNSLTVRENLALAAPPQRWERLLTLFPVLAERMGQRAGTLSGGERKMLGVARLFASDARLCLLDEPTEGVWQAVIEDIVGTLAELKRERAILLVEQNLSAVLPVADYVYVLAGGQVVLEGPAEAIRNHERIYEYLSV